MKLWEIRPSTGGDGKVEKHPKREGDIQDEGSSSTKPVPKGDPKDGWSQSSPNK